MHTKFPGIRSRLISYDYRIKDTKL